MSPPHRLSQTSPATTPTDESPRDSLPTVEGLDGRDFEEIQEITQASEFQTSIPDSTPAGKVSPSSETSSRGGPNDFLEENLQETLRQLRVVILIGDRATVSDSEQQLIDFESLDSSAKQAQGFLRRAQRIFAVLQSKGLSEERAASLEQKLSGFAIRLRRQEEVLSQYAPRQFSSFQSSARPLAPSHSLQREDSFQRFYTHTTLLTEDVSDYLISGVRNYLGDIVGDSTDIFYDYTVRRTRVPAIAIAPRLLDQNFHLIRTVDRSSQQIFWQRLLQRTDLDNLRAGGIRIPTQHLGSYQDFIAHLRSQGIEYPERIHSLTNALVLLHNRQNEGSVGRERPIAVFIGSREDSTGALSRFCIMDDLMASGRFDVLYYEAENPEEMMRHLRRLRNQHGRRIHTLALVGHGSRNHIMLSENSRIRTSSFWRDRHDGNVGNIRLGQLDQIMDPAGQVILASCRNGETVDRDTGDFNNLADAMARFLPGRTIHASGTVNGAFSLQVNSDDSIRLEGAVDAPVVIAADSDQEESRSVAGAQDSGILPPWAGIAIGEVLSWVT